VQCVRPPFLDHLSATEACGSRRSCRRCHDTAGATGRSRTCVLGHEMSRRYVLEHPVDDPDDDDEDDDFDEDDEGDEDEDDDADVETWQVSTVVSFR
jgi:hypothetical protein